jgi:hypothetical protein
MKSYKMKFAVLPLIILLTFIVDTDINAQVFKYGVQAGINLCNPQVADKSDYTDERVFYPLLSFGVNGFISVKSSSFIGFSVEPGFIRKGGTRRDVTIMTGDIIYQPQDFKYTSDYIQLPLFVDFHITEKLCISTGPEIAYHLKSKAKGLDFNYNISDNYNKYELSGSVRLTYSLLDNLDCAITYNHGLTNSSILEWTDVADAIIGTSKVYNQYVQVLFRIKI